MYLPVRNLGAIILQLETRLRRHNIAENMLNFINLFFSFYLEIKEPDEKQSNKKRLHSDRNAF